MYDLLITNAVIVNSDSILKGSVAVKDGKIADIFSGGRRVSAEKTLDAGGHYLYPGFVDCHVHFNEPGYTWRETFAHGSEAAALGGVTTVIDMPMLNKPAVADAAAFLRKRALIDGKSAVDYGFWGALVHSNFGNLAELHKAGVLAYKCFMCDPGKDYSALTPEEIGRALEILKGFDGLSGFHCEDYAMIETLTADKIRRGKLSRQDYLDSRPPEAELKAVKTVLELAKRSGARIHICHVSHPDAAEAVKKAKAAGVRATAETCLHYLIFDQQTLIEKGMLYKCSPPLRKKEEARRLWEYVCDGTIDCICSDHSPATAEEKAEGEKGAFGAWGGISGVQTTAQGLFDFAVHRLERSPTEIARLFSENPAKIFSLFGRKGRIETGFDADFTLIDPELPWEITPDELRYQNKISAFCGLAGRGKPVLTILRGKIVARDGEIPLLSHGKLITGA